MTQALPIVEIARDVSVRILAGETFPPDYLADLIGTLAQNLDEPRG